MESISPVFSSGTEQRYSPPWEDLSIIGIAGSSGSGKTSVAMEIVKSLNLPWVVILVMVSIHFFYLTLEFSTVSSELCASNATCIGFILQELDAGATCQSA